jgi:hypothetical protein
MPSATAIINSPNLVGRGTKLLIMAGQSSTFMFAAALGAAAAAIAGALSAAEAIDAKPRIIAAVIPSLFIMFSCRVVVFVPAKSAGAIARMVLELAMDTQSPLPGA